jgi:hypothetical protein
MALQTAGASGFAQACDGVVGFEKMHVYLGGGIVDAYHGIIAEIALYDASFVDVEFLNNAVMGD